MRAPAKLLILLSCVAVLTACSPSTLPEFDAEQTATDALPDGATHAEVVAESTRFVGKVDEYSLYLAQGPEGELCLIQVRADVVESTGCAEGMGIGTTFTDGTMIEAGSFRFPAAQVGDRERTQLSESVTVLR